MEKTIKIKEDTHKQLKIYCAENGHASLGEGIESLLEKHGGKRK